MQVLYQKKGLGKKDHQYKFFISVHYYDDMNEFETLHGELNNGITLIDEEGILW